MSILVWAVLGLIIGIVANLIDPQPRGGGLVESVILGVLGATLGGFLGSLIFGVGISGVNIPSVAVAALGALLILFLIRAVGGGEKGEI